MKITLEDDLVNPASEDWSAKDDAEVWHAAKAGVPHAKVELGKRESRAAASVRK